MANLQSFRTSLFYLFCFFLSFSFFSGSTARATGILETRDIPTALYDSLVWYFQYASSANAVLLPKCPHPNGNTYVAEISNSTTDTQGFIARDNKKKEIVISFRAATTIQDQLFTDARLSLVPMESPGAVASSDVRVHAGFHDAWNSVARFVLDTVRSELVHHPGYSIVTTGHSLGGALSSLAAITLKVNFPNIPIRMYTYGQPRTGNAGYANWVNSELGPQCFRVTRAHDPTPQIPTREMGYMHHGVEYWIQGDPARPHNVKECIASGEDPDCLNSESLAVSLILSATHLDYLNILSGTPFCF